MGPKRGQLTIRWNDYHEITFTKDGREYRGSYRTQQGKSPGIEVSYGGASKYALLHANPPETLARIMVLELAREQNDES